METLKHKFKKHLGQNFLKNKDIAKKIVNFVGEDLSDFHIVEIGPGDGSLTNIIVEKNPKSLILIERDKDLIETLMKKFPNSQILNKDALDVKLSNISNDSNKMIVISNLPYNIGTILILNWLTEIEFIDKIIVMLQKEVIDRFLAKPGSKNYGITSVLIQSLCNTERLMNISPKNFYPEPKVDSSVIKITPKDNIEIDRDEFLVFKNFIKMLFNQRRRKISSIIKNKEINLDKYSEKRAEELDWKELLLLFRLVSNQ